MLDELFNPVGEGMRWTRLDGKRPGNGGGNKGVAFAHKDERMQALTRRGGHARRQWDAAGAAKSAIIDSPMTTDAIVLFTGQRRPAWARGWVEWKVPELCKGVRLLVRREAK